MPIGGPAAFWRSGCIGVGDAVSKRALTVDVALATGDE
jgi:hypothetical protein